MAVAFPSSTQATSTDAGGAGSTSVSVSPPSGLASGDTWVIVAVVDAIGTTLQVPSGFTAAHAQVVGNQGYPFVRTFWKPAGSSESAVAVSASGGENWILWAASIRATGANANPIGNVATTNPSGSGTTLDAPDVTIQNADSGAIAILAGSPDGSSSTQPITIPSGMTALQAKTAPFPVGSTAYQLVNAGSFTPGDWVFDGWPALQGRVGVTIEILPAAEGGGFQAAWARGSNVLIGV